MRKNKINKLSKSQETERPSQYFPNIFYGIKYESKTLLEDY